MWHRVLLLALFSVAQIAMTLGLWWLRVEHHYWFAESDFLLFGVPFLAAYYANAWVLYPTRTTRRVLALGSTVALAFLSPVAAEFVAMTYGFNTWGS